MEHELLDPRALDYEPGLLVGKIVLSLIGLALAAFCVWLGVRIFNRRERWAKWTAVGLLIGLPALYVLSIGPAFWMERHCSLSDSALDAGARFYSPVVWITENGPRPLRDALFGYVQLWVDL